MKRPSDNELSVWHAWVAHQGFSYPVQMRGITLAKDVALLEGRRLRAPLPKVGFDAFDRGALADALPNPGGYLIASNKLRSLLERESNARIQFLPVRLKGHRKTYAIANILERAACFDRARSQFKAYEDTGGISRLKKLVLKDVPIDGPEVFHLEGIRSVLLFKPRLRALMQEQMPSAGWFTPVSKFQIGYS